MSTQNESDEFAFLRDPHWPDDVKDPRILEFLNQENKTTEIFFAPLQNNIETILEEIKTHIPLKDFTPPFRQGEYTYFQEINEHDDYWTYFRTSLKTGLTETILDVNVLAKGHEFCVVTSVKPSPDNEYLAYCINLEGGEDYTVVIKSLITGEIVDQAVTNVFASLEFHANSQGFFYIPCGDNWRAQNVMFHAITTSDPDILIYEEKDATYWVEMKTSLSHRFLFIMPKAGEYNEIWTVDFEDVLLESNLLKSRYDRHMTDITHQGQWFYALINDKGQNFRCVRTELNSPWSEITEIIPHNREIFLEEIEGYQDFIVVSKKNQGIPEIAVIDPETLKIKHEIDFSKHSSSQSFASFHLTMHYESRVLRYSYSSLSSPLQIWEYDLDTHQSALIKQVKIHPTFSSNDYTVERIYAKSKDGVDVPISLIYKKDLFKGDGSNPLYLYGYGSYGISMELQFRPYIFPLLNRGFVFAIAHIRGGADLGYYWYTDAKFLTKKRTFEDFITCAEHLCDQNYTHSGNIAIEGRSAGGMLIGCAVNMAPELFKCAILGVPFVDVLNTMLDETLPLTATEFEEWGNPKQPEYYDYIRSYSPYENIKSQAYPSMYMTTGIKDPRVGYWEPAKFLAKLKKMKLDQNPLLLETNMAAGHFGRSSRFEQYREYAKEYAFVLEVFKK